MLNNDVREILKALVNINNSSIIAPTMTGADEFKSIIFKANLHKIDSELKEFGIFDTSSFLNALDLLEEPTIELQGNKIVATDINSKMEFITSEISSLDYIQVKESNIDTTVAIDSVLEFAFDSDMLSKIKKASGVFKNFDTLYFNKEDDKVQLSIGLNNSFSKTNNSFTLDIESTLSTDNNFSIALPLYSILKLPNMGYNLKVKYNEKRDAYRIVLDNEILTFVLSLQK